MTAAMGGRVLATLLCTAGVAVGSKVKTLSQYDQVRAEVNGTLDVDMLTEWLEDSHANTMSFLLWDTDGHQYLDMVRFLEATKDRQGAAKIEVWVTLIPPSETEQWVNKSDCGRCPPDRPHPYGSATSGTYCCDNATATKVDHCDSKTPECCVAPGSVLGCQGIPRCGNNPDGTKLHVGQVTQGCPLAHRYAPSLQIHRSHLSTRASWWTSRRATADATTMCLLRRILLLNTDPFCIGFLCCF